MECVISYSVLYTSTPQLKEVKLRALVRSEWDPILMSLGEELGGSSDMLLLYPSHTLRALALAC